MSANYTATKKKKKKLTHIKPKAQVNAEWNRFISSNLTDISQIYIQKGKSLQTCTCLTWQYYYTLHTLPTQTS